MTSVVKRATRSFSLRTMRKKNENKVQRPADDSDDESSSSSPASSPSKSKVSPPPSSSLIPSPRSATTHPSPRGSTVPSPASSPGSLSGPAEAIAINDSGRSDLHEVSRGRLNSMALSPRRAAALEEDVIVGGGGDKQKSEGEGTSIERSDSGGDESGKTTPRKKGRGRANSSPATRPSIVPSLTGLNSLSPNSSTAPNDVPSSSSPSSPRSPASPKGLSSSKSSSAAQRKGGGGGEKLKQSKSARMPRSARGEGGGFYTARAGVSCSSPSSLSSPPSSSLGSSSSSRLGSSSSRRGEQGVVVEVVMSADNTQGWVRKHHITAEEAKDHNTLVALMPSSMRRNIPMGDLLSSTQWTIDDAPPTPEKSESETESESDSEKRGEERKRVSKSTNSTPHGSGEVDLVPFKKPTVGALSVPSPRDQSLLRTSSKDGPDKSGGFKRRGSAIAAVIASPRNWLGKKDDNKEGMPAAGATESSSPKGGERWKGWWDKKEKEDVAGKGDSSSSSSSSEGSKKEDKWRSRSKRRLRKKAEGGNSAGEQQAENANVDKIHADRDLSPSHESHLQVVEEPSEGEDEEDIRGEEDQPAPAVVASKAAGEEDGVSSNNNKAAGMKESGEEEETSKGAVSGRSDGEDEEASNGHVGQQTEAKAMESVSAGKTKKKALSVSEERRPSIVAKTVKMAMEEELLSRVKERAPTVTITTARDSSGMDANDEDDEEEDELFFSEANEAVVIQLPHKAE